MRDLLTTTFVDWWPHLIILTVFIYFLVSCRQLTWYVYFLMSFHGRTGGICDKLFNSLPDNLVFTTSNMRSVTFEGILRPATSTILCTLTRQL
jgi:hypothetical protein